jgi:hypothetical protein
MRDTIRSCLKSRQDREVWMPILERLALVGLDLSGIRMLAVVSVMIESCARLRSCGLVNVGCLTDGRCSFTFWGGLFVQYVNAYRARW